MFYKVWFFLCLWHVVGVFGVTYEMKSVMEGDSATLHTDREMSTNDMIVWSFGPKKTLIVEIKVMNDSVTVNDDYDARFKGRTEVDYQTGCLTILRTRIEHAGRYELQTGRVKKFYVLTVHGPFGENDEKISLSVMEGDSFTLHTASEMINNPISWRFGNYLIAEIQERAKNITVYDYALGGRFRDRINVDPQTGSLTITNTAVEHAGFYQLQTNHTKKIFILSICAPLPVPVIFSYCPQSSESKPVLLCSVLNVSHVTLSWYKGNSLLSSISVSDFSISLSLPLEVGYQDTNTYSCVLNNSCADQTQHLEISQVCQTYSCDSVEAVMRLVVSALVGVAAVAAVVVLLYDIRSRRAQQDRAYSHSSST